MLKSLFATLVVFAPVFAFATPVTCQTETQVEGWTGAPTRDYVTFTADAKDGRLLDAQIAGAYRSDRRDVKVDGKPRLPGFNRFEALEDAWSWFVPLMPEDVASGQGEFQAYLQVFSEQGYKTTLKLRCN